MKVRKFYEQRQQVETLDLVDFSKLTVPMIVIYDKPLDFPESFIGRIWDIDKGKAMPTNTFIVRDSIEEIREDILNAGFFYKFERAAGDDPSIVETWMR